jgi:hypothetical protein
LEAKSEQQKIAENTLKEKLNVTTPTPIIPDNKQYIAIQIDIQNA